jgi:hypothetical protein
MAFDVYFVGSMQEQLQLTPNFLTIRLLSRLNGYEEAVWSADTWLRPWPS